MKRRKLMKKPHKLEVRLALSSLSQNTKREGRVSKDREGKDEEERE